MYHIHIQFAGDRSLAPSPVILRKWAKHTLQKHLHSAELTIRIVDVPEMSDLNFHYRKKKGPTNVLSFPFHVPDTIQLSKPLLGDIVICSDIVQQEAETQQKNITAHWAHMVVHGVFHLLGYDHENDQDAEQMESLEISVMKDLGFKNPYQNNGV